MSTNNKRVIKIFSTQGRKTNSVETSVTTWGDLKPQLTELGYKLKSLHATENIGKHDLAHDGATLPEGNFTIFLRPKETKSGMDVSGKTFQEIRAVIKTSPISDNIKSYLNDYAGEGRNWTNLGTDDMIKALADFNDNSQQNTSKKKTSKTKVEKTAPEPVIEEVAEVEEVMISNMTVEECYVKLRELGQTQSDVLDRLDVILGNEVAAVVESVKADKEAKAEEQKLEDEANADEFAEMEGGFN